jgi:hypothetical protein
VDGNQIIVKLNNKSEIYTKYLADKTHWLGWSDAEIDYILKQIKKEFK